MATLQDAEHLLAIYAPYVTSSAITFEYTIPTLEEFKSRMQTTMQRFPYLVILQNNKVCGYAYASFFKPRAAYDRAVETTIYLDQDCKGSGLGKKLYLALEAVLKQQHVINLNACITPASPPYVDGTSVLFHQKLGYSKVAHFTKCGYKFEQWFDVIWMEKFINEHSVNPPPFIPISELNKQDINHMLSLSLK